MDFRRQIRRNEKSLDLNLLKDDSGKLLAR